MNTRLKNLRGANWNTARISEMLRNPVYVQADIDVYQFFQSQGANIYNRQVTSRVTMPAISTKVWFPLQESRVIYPTKRLCLRRIRVLSPLRHGLACRIRCLNNRQSTKTCKPKNSWLVGKVKCGKCGYALTIRKAKTRWGRYFVCSQSGSRGSNCTGAGCTVYADVFGRIYACRN